MGKYTTIDPPVDNPSGGGGGPEEEAPPIRKGKYSDVGPTGKTPPDPGFWQGEIDELKKSGKNAVAAVGHMAKGVPILGNFVPDNQWMKDYEDDRPAVAKGLQFAGGVASTLPLGMGLGLIPGAVRQTAAGAGLGALLSAGDSATNSNRKWSDLPEDIAWGGITGATGPLLGKLLSPKAVPGQTLMKPNVPPSGVPPMGSKYIFSRDRTTTQGAEALRRAQEAAAASAKARAQNAPMPNFLNNDANIRRLSAAALGSMGMYSMGPAGLLAGAIPYTPAMARSVVRGARGWPHATWAGRNIPGTPVSTKDLVRALMLNNAPTKGESEE